MKRLFFAACGLLLLGACAVQEEVVEDIGGVYINGVFVAYCSAEPAPVMYTKNGLPMIDDQACIPEPEVLGVIVVGGPDGPAVTVPGPTPPPGCEGDDCPVTPPPGCEENCGPPPGCEENCGPPPQPPGGGGCNNGRGNGGEDCDPGNSGKNRGGDDGSPSGGNQGGGNQGGGNPNAGGGNPNSGKPASKGIDHLSTAEQAFMLWDYNNRIDYEAYWQWLLDNGLVIAE